MHFSGVFLIFLAMIFRVESELHHLLIPAKERVLPTSLLSPSLLRMLVRIHLRISTSYCQTLLSLTNATNAIYDVVLTFQMTDVLQNLKAENFSMKTVIFEVGVLMF